MNCYGNVIHIKLYGNILHIKCYGNVLHIKCYGNILQIKFYAFKFYKSKVIKKNLFTWYYLTTHDIELIRSLVDLIGN